MGHAILTFLVVGISGVAADQVRIDRGVLDGTTGRVPGVRIFKGVPFAAPPVGNLRWHAPKPAPSWTGVRTADEFGNRCIQTNAFPDQIWRDKQESEDCLYVAIWTPAKKADER